MFIKNQRRYGVFVIIASIIGFIASFTLVIEKIHKLENPMVNTLCDINPFVSCGKLMQNWQSQLFGFPNQMIGVAAFAIALFYGVLMASKIPLPRWMHVCFNFGTLLGAVFITWLFTQSVFVIGSLCVWCIVVWAVHIPLFVYTTLRNCKRGYFGTAIRDNNVVQFFIAAPGIIILVWDAIIFLSILIVFYDAFAAMYLNR